ncbi:DUF4367 domain-containing protein [Lachnospiraceae bacterium 47-T17]
MCERNDPDWLDEYLYQIMPMAEEAMLRSLDEELTAAPEHVFSKRFERRMKRLIRMERLGLYGHGRKRAVRAAAAALLIAAGVLLAAVLSVEASRVKLVEWLLDIHDEYTNIATKKKDSDESIAFETAMPSYIPDGYTAVDREKSAATNTVQYANEQGKIIEFDQVRAEGMSFLVDTEDAVTGTVVIGDISYHTIKKGDRFFIYWTDEIYAYTILGWENQEELLKMAESVKGF